MYIYNVLHYTTIEMYISILCIDNRNECVGLNLTQMAPFEKKEQTCIHRSISFSVYFPREVVGISFFEKISLKPRRIPMYSRWNTVI